MDEKSGPEGLSEIEAASRLQRDGPNTVNSSQRARGLRLFLSQFKSPLILLLIGASILSLFLSDSIDASLILVIVVFSGLLGFFQERGAIHALESLLKLVTKRATVVRDGKEREIPVEELVVGDVVVLRAGNIIPADCEVSGGNRFCVDEAILTGESAPVEKGEGSSLFMGTIAISGVASARIVATGKGTEYGHLVETARFQPPVTAFEIGVRKFGQFLLIVTITLVVIIFGANVLLHRPMLESFLFSLALAVGLTPQLLPAIISVNLSHGARKMAEKQVVVKRLASIENFGQMNVLCSDKTGTITLGKIALDRAVDSEGKESEKVALYGFLNAHFQTSYANPMDQSILEKLRFDQSDLGDWKMSGEIPYDFERKRLSVLFGNLLITKGSVPQVLAVCNRMEGSFAPIDKGRLQAEFEKQSAAGLRTLAVAYGEGEREENLTFLGFLYFSDPLKPDIAATVEELRKKGILLKIITGDHHSVALHIAQAIGMAKTHLVTGEEFQKASEAERKKIVREKNIFAEIHPNEKEKIVSALRQTGHVVGYLGDGINDIAALHSADVSIAVEGGADAAKETADIVLLEKDLSVLRAGVEAGRLTFANTLKYVFMATSANFGNMFSMAGASLFLPFLPLLPKQVLLMNLLTDVPEMAIASDAVDADIVYRPVKWDLRFICRFMLLFGPLSSIFDYATFGVLLYWLKADEALFQTGWFVESVVSATLVVLAIRTRHSLFRSKPGKLLTLAVLTVSTGVLFIPYLPLLSFVPLPPLFYFALAPIVALYLISVEIAKRFFFHRKAR